MQEKHPCRTRCVLSNAWIRDLSLGLEFNSNVLVGNYFFLNSEGAVSHNYQQLFIARYQVSFYANNYIKYLPTVLIVPLKAVDTIGKCQRLAFTVGVSQHMHKITNLWKF